MDFGIILSLMLINSQQIDLKLYLILGFRLKLSCALIKIRIFVFKLSSVFKNKV